MKKVIIGLLALTSLTAFADVGSEVYSITRFETAKDYGSYNFVSQSGAKHTLNCFSQSMNALVLNSNIEKRTQFIELKSSLYCSELAVTLAKASVETPVELEFENGVLKSVKRKNL